MSKVSKVVTNTKTQSAKGSTVVKPTTKRKTKIKKSVVMLAKLKANEERKNDQLSISGLVRYCQNPERSKTLDEYLKVLNDEHGTKLVRKSITSRFVNTNRLDYRKKAKNYSYWCDVLLVLSNFAKSKSVKATKPTVKKAAKVVKKATKPTVKKAA
jgi:hypothetical protein